MHHRRGFESDLQAIWEPTSLTSYRSLVKDEHNEEETKPPPQPNRDRCLQSPAHSIDVKGDSVGPTDAVHVKDNVEVTAEDDGTPVLPSRSGDGEVC